MLTTFNGETITYDEIGNPLSYRNGYSFVWQNGRQLSSVTKNNNNIATYSYNADGLRIGKNVNGTQTDYYWLNGVLYGQSTNDESLFFLYDENGRAYGFVLKNSTVEETYYYEFNLQGDIIGIINSNGNRVVQYCYGAWGDTVSITGSLADTIGQINPMRYRGYYFDAETGFYYLQSRYYDPEIGRFINADSVVSNVRGDVSGYNLFAYCFNNPVNKYDSLGYWPKFIKDAANWVDKNIIKPVENFANGIGEDISNFDLNNQSEARVLESNYFSFYKGVPVIRTNGDRSGSFGAIFLTRETNSRNDAEDIVRHEYGHTKQLKQLGIVKYSLCIGLPSWQEWGNGEYYSKPWEITADLYGSVQSRFHSESNIYRGVGYLEGSKMIGPFIWFFVEQVICMKKNAQLKYITLILPLCIIFVFFCACKSAKKTDYYSQKENYICVEGIISHIKYDEASETLYLGFSELSSTLDDNNFKIVGENLEIIQTNKFEDKVKIGEKITFITAPRYFGDGYVMPIVAVSSNGESYLEFEEGYKNFLNWLSK